MTDTKRPMINESLRLLRLYCGFSQADMAQRLAVAQSMVSDVEAGRKNVSMDLLEAYSRATGVKMSQLLFFAEAIDGEPIARRGRLIIADKVLKLLEVIKPVKCES
jgi:transcriptional regulator with XRE-family HTH domain